ncbi:MAG TPA: hypothetical protein GXX19_00215 [Syntrophomonadaceae bacterium]|nr:hypothetical protein [Syntrophomonadaceae bacterium]
MGDNGNKKQQREAAPLENRNGQPADNEAPPMKARYLRDLFGKGAIKRESKF